MSSRDMPPPLLVALVEMTEARDLCKRQTGEALERLATLRSWLHDNHPEVLVTFDADEWLGDDTLVEGFNVRSALAEYRLAVRGCLYDIEPGETKWIVKNRVHRGGSATEMCLFDSEHEALEHAAIVEALVEADPRPRRSRGLPAKPLTLRAFKVERLR
jgi:hypothetical protein